jgi:hypothetical protein
VIIPWPIEIFSLGNLSLTIPNAIGNIDMPIPWIALAISIKYMLEDKPAKQTPRA